MGVFLFALLIDYVHTKMQPSAFQASALQWVMMSSVEDENRQTAAKIIQLAWRRYRYRNVTKDNKKLDKRTKRENKEKFTLSYTKMVNKARRIRREKGRLIRQFGFDVVGNVREKNVERSIVEIKEEMKEIKELLLEMKRGQESVPVSAKSMSTERIIVSDLD